ARLGAFGRNFARALPAPALAFVQGAGTSWATERIAQHYGVRSEVGQMAIGLGLNALFSAGTGAFGAWRSRAQQVERLSRVMAESVAGENARPELVRGLQADLQTFLRTHGEGMPNEAAYRGLREGMYQRFGIDPASTEPAHVERRQAIDGFVESLRIERAAGRAYQGVRDGRDTSPLSAEETRTVIDQTASELALSRGDSGEGARVRAVQDAARFYEARLRAEATEVRASDPTRAAALDRAADAARDRGIAAEITAGLRTPEADGRTLLTAESARRVEDVITRELSGDGTRPLSERAREPGFVEGLERKLRDEAGLDADTARDVARRVVRDLEHRGLVESSGHVVLGELGVAATPRALELAAMPEYRELARTSPDRARALAEANESSHVDLSHVARMHGLEAAEAFGRLHRESPAALAQYLRHHGAAAGPDALPGARFEAAMRAFAADPAAAIVEARGLVDAHVAAVDPAGSVHLRALSGEETRAALARTDTVAQRAGHENLQITPERLAGRGLEPRWSVELDGQRMLLSDPFDLGDGRSGMIGYVEHEGRLRAQIFYRSNSQSAWRTSDASRDGHYGKGVAEVDTALPIQLTAAAHRMANRGTTLLFDPANRGPVTDSGEMGRAAEELFRGNVHNLDRAEFMRAAFADQPIPGLEIHYPHYYTTDYGNAHERVSVGDHDATAEIRTPGGLHEPDPARMALPPPEQLPDFTRPPDETFEFESRAYREVTGDGHLRGSVYTSRDGSLRYLVLEDSQGRMAVVGAERTDSPLTRWGNRQHYVDLHGMDAPLYEYQLQISERHGGLAQTSDYQLNWQFVRETPLVREIYRQRGLTVPEALPEANGPNVRRGRETVPGTIFGDLGSNHVNRAVHGVLDANVSGDLGVGTRAQAARDALSAIIRTDGRPAAQELVRVGDAIGTRPLAELLASGDGAAVVAGRERLTP
ncbi:hypothetical protein L6R52_42200, partial [Myxococcota bacterium]|nr:hypothetical protein [Myxococcota bacterium]